MLPFEDLDDQHRFSTSRAGKHRIVAVIVIARGDCYHGTEQLTGKVQRIAAFGVREKPVVADPMESAWQYVNQEPANKLRGGQRHG